MNKGRLITLEGSEGAGKTTALKVICGVLDVWEVDYICTREPGGEPVAEKIRDILLNSVHLHAKTELLLMFASRNEHIENVIKPALLKGQWVVSDRYVDASYAYQGGGRELGFDTVKWFDEFIVNKFKPDYTILMDIDPKIGLERIKSRGQADRIEKEGLDFFYRITKAYIQKAKIDSHRYSIINASQTIEEVANSIRLQLKAQKKRLL